MVIDEQERVFDVKSGSRGRIDYHIVAEVADSRRCIGYVYPTASWDVGIYQQYARDASLSRVLVAPVESLLKGQFVDVALRCWLVTASQRKSWVSPMERGFPNPESAGGDGEPSADNQSAAVHKYFPLPVDLRNPGAHGIAGGIAQKGRLAFARASSRVQRSDFIMHVHAKYHPDKYPRNLVVAT